MRLQLFRVFLLTMAVLFTCTPWLTSQSPAETVNPAGALWKDPGDVATYDFTWGPGGAELAPKPPFSFLEEDLGGTTPKVKVRDANRRLWAVKFGEEAPAEAFATRLAWAAGYWVQPTYYVAKGRIINARMSPKPLERVRIAINEKDGAFTNARFELRADQPKFLRDETWSWKENPFLGTREFAGLRILIMLTSNWDTVGSGSGNMAIFEDARNANARYYVYTDWGASMGRWGNIATRQKWDCSGFARQSAKFVTGVENGMVKWGFKGKERDIITTGITVDDVRWLMQHLGRVTDEQLRAGLRASGADDEDVECFQHAIRDRLAQLQYVAETGQAPQ